MAGRAAWASLAKPVHARCDYDGMVEELVKSASIHARLANAVLEEADDYIDFVDSYDSAAARGMKVVPKDDDEGR